MNLVVIMGRLTREPNLHQGANTLIANISVAVDRRFQRDVTDFFDCTAYGKTAEFVEKYLHKGTKVVISGEIQNNIYEKDGVKHYGNRIIINSVEFAESKKKEDDFEQVESDEGIPFV